MRLRDFYTLDRRREIGPRGHPIPDLVKIALQILLELLDRATIYPCGTLIGLYLQIRLPHLPFRDVERLNLRFQLAHAAPPSTFLVDRTNEPRTIRPLRSTPTAPSRNFTATTNRSANTLRIGTQFLTGCPLGRLPLTAPDTPAPFYRSVSSHVPHGSSRPGSRRLHAGHHLASKRAPARLIPGQKVTPGSDAI